MTNKRCVVTFEDGYRISHHTNSFTFIVDRENDVLKGSKNYMKYCCDGKCTFCSSPINLELDHIVPCMFMGSHKTHNLQWLCKRCHKFKTLTDKRFLNYCRKNKLGGSGSFNNFHYVGSVNTIDKLHSKYKEFFVKEHPKVVDQFKDKYSKFGDRFTNGYGSYT